ncbi:universal stress protein UspA [Halodesulfurarchaeum formicicum]|uniref:Universal stress protein UspA n=2 Tax=Halodesulfurarchaeum formicicum TaxID=1873524 RepID=A0A1D8S706_9EURY|nr:universal stress protein UspA [Halodesulfurarchaeum formicicum]APE96482.1 universal stress protein UspA [Halodesulfurarchaeum formicicum]
MPAAAEISPMRVLVPIDGSAQSNAALEYAVDTFAPDELVLLHVIDPVEAGYSAAATMPGYSEEWYENRKEEAETLFEEATASLDGIDTTTVTEVGRPSRAIVSYVEEHDVDHVVMGSHGRSGMTRILLGSVAESVVRRSPIPVTIVR